MDSDYSPTPFNSPLETGIRSLTILHAAYPVALDLQRLVEMDYLVVHSGDVGGPDSLHAPLPLRVGELLVRRGLIEKGLILIMSRGLLQRCRGEDGFSYMASENAAPFMASLTDEYSVSLKDRAHWAVDRFADTSTEEVRTFTHRFFARWSSQFQSDQYIGDSA